MLNEMFFLKGYRVKTNNNKNLKKNQKRKRKAVKGTFHGGLGDTVREAFWHPTNTPHFLYLQYHQPQPFPLLNII